MTPIKLLIDRLEYFKGKEFESYDVCFSEHGISNTSLRSCLKRAVDAGAVKIIRTTKQGARIMHVYVVNEKMLEKFTKEKAVYCTRKYYTSDSSVWAKVWPEFFKAPKFKVTSSSRQLSKE